MYVDRRGGRVATSLVVAILTFAFASAAQAAPLAGSVFDSNDGDQVTDVLPPASDWQDVAGAPYMTTNLDNQAADDCFIGGVKEETPDAWNFDTAAGGCTPGKSDLLGMWAHPELTPTASILHASFVRQSATGNTFITFELNKSGVAWTNSVGASIPCRSDGDILLSYDVGGSAITVTLYRWTGSGGPASCPNGATGSFTASAALNNGQLNSGAITNYLSTSVIGSSIAANLFGEAQIDVASVLASMGITGCFSYIQAQAHTRSSSSISSSLIDDVKPSAVKIANCAVTGLVFGDDDKDGVRDASETGMAGRTVYVDVNANGSPDSGEPSATTDAQGYYLIPTTFTSGTFPVRVVVPGGMVCTAPVGCTYNSTFTPAGANSVNTDFGLFTPATMSGSAHVDTDGDGSRGASENTPISGLTIFDDANSNGSADPGESSTTTAADGSYTLGGLGPGVVRLRIAGGSGYTCDSPVPCVHVVSVLGGQTLTGRDFLAYQAPSVAGTVYTDLDASAARDAGEPGAAGITVKLYAADGTTLLATTTTGGTGDYAFTTSEYPAFAPGTYVVKISVPGGFSCSAGCIRSVVLASGQSLTGQDAGLYQQAAVGGAVFADSDGDGTRAVSDGPRSGMEVWADLDLDGARDPGEPYAVTDPSGHYQLSGLTPGSYTIRVELPVGWHCSPLCSLGRTVTSGGSATADFGQYADATAAGSVYADLDDSGARDAGEGPVGSVTLELDRDRDGTIDASVASLPDGSYSFGGLAPGDYRVTVVAPGGFVCSGPSPCRYDFTLTSGGASPAADFGLYHPPAADLSLTKAAPATAHQNAVFDYTLTAANAGLDTAVGVVVTDVLPSGVDFISASAGCSESSGTVTCTVGSLASGASAVETITVRATGAGDVTNTATASAATADPNPANNSGTATVAVAATADVSVSKAGPATVAAGGELTYTLTAANQGPSAAHDVVLADPLPPGTTFVSASAPAGVACVTPAVGGGGTVTCSAATLASGDSFQVLVTVAVPVASAEQTLTNSATIASDEVDEASANNTASVQTVVGKSSDLSLEKTASATTVARDAQVMYTLKATNNGPSDATNVTVSDALPAGMAFVSASAGCAEVGAVVTCAVGSVANGASAAATITVRAVAEGTQINSASVSSDNPDPSGADNDATATVSVTPVADLSITKTGPASVAAGGSITYTLTVTDNGPSDATGVSAADALPAGLDFVSATASQGSCANAGGTVTCDLGDLADGASATVTITATASFAVAGTAVSNTATVGGAQADATSANDAATHVVDVGPAADLTLTKSAPANVPAGGTLTYTLDLANAGPQAAVGATVTDVLPAGETFVSATTSQGSCADSGQSVTCDLGDIAPDGAVHIDLVAMVDASIAGQDLHNTATATSETTEVDAASNSDDATTRVDAVADQRGTPPNPPVSDPVPDPSPPAHRAATGPKRTRLALTLAAQRRVVTAGRTVWLTVRARNAGAAAARHVLVCVTPPAAVTFVRIAGRAAFSAGRACRRLASLAKGRAVSFRVKARVARGTEARRVRDSAVVTASNAATRRATRSVRVVAPRVARGGGVTG